MEKVYSSNKWNWNNHTFSCRNLDTDYITFTKINPKGVTDLNVKYKTIKISRQQQEKIYLVLA